MDPIRDIFIYLHTYLNIERDILVYTYIYIPHLMISPKLEAQPLWFIFLLIPGEGWRQTWLSNLSGKPNLIGHAFLDLHHEKPQKVNSSPLKMDGWWLEDDLFTFKFWEAHFSGASIDKLRGGVHRQPQATIRMSRWKSSTEFGSRSIMKQNAAPG